jgi:predicted transcriptional regulator
MATTISIDDEIFEQLKARAEREATTVNRLIEDSLRRAVLTRDEHAPDEPFKLVTFGRGWAIHQL